MTVPRFAREEFGDFSLLHRSAVEPRQMTVHLAHATGFNAETYLSLLESLDPALEVYAVDARGHGLSRARAVPRELRSWRRYQYDLQAFLETVERPVVLVGHSGGATASLQIAAEHPSWVAGLLLIEPVLVPPDKTTLAWWARLTGLSKRLPIARGAARRRMEFPSQQEAVDNYEGKGAFRTWPRPWIEAYVRGGTREVPDGVRLTCERDWESRTFAVATTNPYLYIRRLQCPVTILTAQPQGPPCDAESTAEFVRLRPDTRLVLVEGASHFLPMEKPDMVRHELNRLLERIAAS